MKNLILHKYLSVNLFFYINFINFFNLLFFIYLIITGYTWMLHFAESVYLIWAVIAIICIPVSGIFVIVEYILRKSHVINVNCNDLFSQKQIKIIYCTLILLFLLYFLWLLFCQLPPTPAEIEAMRYD